MHNSLYTQREVSKIFPDVPNKTLIYWARQGLVEWAAETRDARGIARLYNSWNLFQIALVRELAGLGIFIEKIRRIMSFFEDFPAEGHYSCDNEGNKVLETCLRSEFFSSENGLKYKLIIIKKMDDRGWQEPTIIGTSNLTDDNDLFKREFGLLMNIHTTVIINLSTIHDYVDCYIKKADLS
jgi:DNA-binding transcriptional MerR regulator